MEINILGCDAPLPLQQAVLTPRCRVFTDAIELAFVSNEYMLRMMMHRTVFYECLQKSMNSLLWMILQRLVPETVVLKHSASRYPTLMTYAWCGGKYLSSYTDYLTANENLLGSLRSHSVTGQKLLLIYEQILQGLLTDEAEINLEVPD